MVRTISAIRWGEEPADLLLLHGGAQNAHTWDTVALALGRPLLAVDLAGHGRSSWRDDGRYVPAELADDVAATAAAAAVLTTPCDLVGMSLGGLTWIALAAHHPDLVRRLSSST